MNLRNLMKHHSLFHLVSLDASCGGTFWQPGLSGFWSSTHKFLTYTLIKMVLQDMCVCEKKHSSVWHANSKPNRLTYISLLKTPNVSDRWFGAVLGGYPSSLPSSWKFKLGPSNSSYLLTTAIFHFIINGIVLDNQLCWPAFLPFLAGKICWWCDSDWFLPCFV